MKLILMMPVIVSVAILAAPTMAQKAADGMTIEAQAEQQVWIDEHARWNAEHMAAARRLTDISAALKRHDTNFDAHGNALRVQMRTTDRAESARTQARLRAAHEEARSAHHHLMADVDALASVMSRKFDITTK